MSYTTSYAGYSWMYKTNKEIEGGFLSSTKYATLTEAQDACLKNKKCTGVQWIGKKSFYLLKGTKEQKKQGRKFWFKGGKKYTSAGRVWGMYTNYKIKGAKVSKKPYTTISAALLACGSKGACRGVNKIGSTEFYMMKGNSVEVNKGTSAYLQGG